MNSSPPRRARVSDSRRQLASRAETSRKVKGYTDAAAPGRDWNLATAMVMQEKAAFQFMGDWAKGEFVAAGKVPGKDFLCAAAPGTSTSYTFNSVLAMSHCLRWSPGRRRSGRISRWDDDADLQGWFSR